MKRSIRKTAAGVWVTYSNGNFSNNLTGSDFAVEESQGHICLRKVARTCCPRSAAFHDRTHKNRRPLRSEVCATRLARR